MTIGTLKLPKEFADRFEVLAREKGESINSLIFTALQEWLEDQEDIANAEEVMSNILKGKEKVYSAKEVWDRLGVGNLIY